MGNHFYIDAKVYFTVAIFLLLFQKSNTKIMQLVFKLNRMFLVTISMAYLFFVFLEGSHFTNYVLSKYHFHLDGLILPVLFSLSIFLIGKFKDEIPKSVSKIGILYPLIVFLLIFFMVKNLSVVSDTAFNRNSYIFFHLNSSYDERMSYQWGIFYKFMVFVRNNTPADATIVIPPEQDPWLMGSGNDNFVRAFLYPRKIVSQTKIIPEQDLKTFGPQTYILITWGKEACRPEPECHGWPRQEVAAKRIIYKNPDTSEVAEVKQNTTYSLKGSKYVYGLIEI
jgi:hypothetical protein